MCIVHGAVCNRGQEEAGFQPAEFQGPSRWVGNEKGAPGVASLHGPWVSIAMKSGSVRDVVGSKQWAVGCGCRLRGQFIIFFRLSTWMSMVRTESSGPVTFSSSSWRTNFDTIATAIDHRLSASACPHRSSNCVLSVVHMQLIANRQTRENSGAGELATRSTKPQAGSSLSDHAVRDSSPSTKLPLIISASRHDQSMRFRTARRLQRIVRGRIPLFVSSSSSSSALCPSITRPCSSKEYSRISTRFRSGGSDINQTPPIPSLEHWRQVDHQRSNETAKTAQTSEDNVGSKKAD